MSFHAAVGVWRQAVRECLSEHLLRTVLLVCIAEVDAAEPLSPRRWLLAGVLPLGNVRHRADRIGRAAGPHHLPQLVPL